MPRKKRSTLLKRAFISKVNAAKRKKKEENPMVQEIEAHEEPIPYEEIKREEPELPQVGFEGDDSQFLHQGFGDDPGSKEEEEKNLHNEEIATTADIAPSVFPSASTSPSMKRRHREFSDCTIENLLDRSNFYNTVDETIKTPVKRGRITSLELENLDLVDPQLPRTPKVAFASNIAEVIAEPGPSSRYDVPLEEYEVISQKSKHPITSKPISHKCPKIRSQISKRKVLDFESPLLIDQALDLLKSKEPIDFSLTGQLSPSLFSDIPDLPEEDLSQNISDERAETEFSLSQIGSHLSPIKEVDENLKIIDDFTKENGQKRGTVASQKVAEAFLLTVEEHRESNVLQELEERTERAKEPPRFKSRETLFQDFDARPFGFNANIETCIVQLPQFTKLIKNKLICSSCDSNDIQVKLQQCRRSYFNETLNLYCHNCKKILNKVKCSALFKIPEESKNVQHTAITAAAWTRAVLDSGIGYTKMARAFSTMNIAPLSLQTYNENKKWVGKFAMKKGAKHSNKSSRGSKSLLSC